MTKNIARVLDKLDKGYYTEDTHLLIVLYNEARHDLAKSWNLDVQRRVEDFPGHVNVITIEDLSNFLGLDQDSNKKLFDLMEHKKGALRGDEEAFNKLITLKDEARLSLSQMRVNQYWFDKFLGSR